VPAAPHRLPTWKPYLEFARPGNTEVAGRLSFDWAPRRNDEFRVLSNRRRQLRHEIDDRTQSDGLESFCKTLGQGPARRHDPCGLSATRAPSSCGRWPKNFAPHTLYCPNGLKRGIVRRNISTTCRRAPAASAPRCFWIYAPQEPTETQWQGVVARAARRREPCFDAGSVEGAFAREAWTRKKFTPEERPPPLTHAQAQNLGEGDEEAARSRWRYAILRYTGDATDRHNKTDTAHS